jgi:hypothetical protein
MHSEQVDEVRLFQLATQFNRWRWRAEEKRLRRQGQASPFSVHLGELQMMHMIWRELRRDAGLPPGKPPPTVWRIALGLAARKFRQFLREYQS